MPHCATHGHNVISCTSMCPLIADSPSETDGPEPRDDEDMLVLSGDDIAADTAALAARVGSEELARQMLAAPGSPYHENPTAEQEREQLAAMERELAADRIEGPHVIEVKSE